MVEENSAEFVDHLIRFMHSTGKQGTHMYVFPDQDDKCWMKEVIMCTIDYPCMMNAHDECSGDSTSFHRKVM